jgi:hypothetical protein
MSHPLTRVAAPAAALLTLLAWASPALAAPPTPTDFHVQATSATKVALSWKAQPTVSNYEVRRNGTVVATPGPNQPRVLLTEAAGTTASYTVRAVDPTGGSAQTAAIQATTKSTATPLSTCLPNSVLAAGAYRLTANISMTDGTKPCFTLGPGASLDGASKLITVTAATQTSRVINLPSGNNMMVHNLNMTTKGEGFRVGPYWPLPIGQYAATDVALYSNTVAGQGNGGVNGLETHNVSNLTVSASTFFKSRENLNEVTDAVFSGNFVSMGSVTTYSGAVVRIGDSTRVTMGNNTIDGVNAANVDDLIVVDGPAYNTVVSDNQLRNAEDAGIEFLDYIEGGRFERNTITNTHFVGIGQWYQTGFNNGIIRGNTVDGASYLMQLSVGGQWNPLYPTYFAPLSLNFVANTLVENNTLTNQVDKGRPPVCLIGVKEFPGPVLFFNNTVRNNTATGATTQMRVWPLSGLTASGNTGNTPGIAATEPPHPVGSQPTC